MYRQKLCLSLIGQLKTPQFEQPALYKSAGFEAFFPCFESKSQMLTLADKAKALSMEIQSVHAPYRCMRAFWYDAPEGDAAQRELEDCIEAAGEANVPIAVCHAYIGFYTGEQPTKTGLNRVEKLVKLAQKAGVKLAFENTEGEEFLKAILDEFQGEKTVGFCWDTGHEQCYGYGEDFIKKYGNRLIATHINDNLGVSRLDGRIDWTDDLHLLPFDGIIDWRNLVKRLNDVRFDGTLTFELNKNNKPNRHELDKYEQMTDEQYIAEAYARACRVAEYKRRELLNRN